MDSARIDSGLVCVGGGGSVSGSRVERECQWQAVGILSATERTSGARTLTTMFMFTCRRSSSCRIALRHQHRADEPSSPTAVGYRFTGGRRLGGRRLPLHRRPSATASPAAVGYQFTGSRRLTKGRIPPQHQHRDCRPSAPPPRQRKRASPPTVSTTATFSPAPPALVQEGGGHPSPASVWAGLHTPRATHPSPASPSTAGVIV